MDPYSKTAIGVLPLFFDRYILQVEEENLHVALQNSLEKFQNYNFELLSKLKDSVYAPGKWTIRDIIQHLIDNERVQSYRAMRIARNDTTILPGYDEQLFADNSNACQRSLGEIKHEFELLRASNILLFKSFTKEAIARKGICYQVEISALALGFQLVGHQIHHFKVIEERYLPLL